MFIKSNFIPVELYNEKVLPEFSDKPISLFNDCIPTVDELNINPYNILLIQEPNQLFGLHDWALNNAHYFSCILTWSQEILDKCDNALLLPFGTTFLHKDKLYETLAIKPKKLEVSFLCGPKNIITGHFLRQSIYKKETQVQIPTEWVYSCPVEDKYKCFENSMFHLTIENSQNKNYFTEKIVDAFITKTIPIYWGCPNISEFFDSRGFFTFNTEEEFFNIVNNLTSEDYISRKPYIEANYQTSIYYANIFSRINNILHEIVKLNNI